MVSIGIDIEIVKPVTTDAFSLEGKTAIVTGASKGIGLELANGLSIAGARVVAVARSKGPKQALGKNVKYRRCDVSDEKSFSELLEKENTLKSGIDILINAAGITKPGTSIDGLKKTLKTNVIGPYITTYYTSKIMIKNQKGSIINITSLAAYRGFPNNPAYVASKGALSQMTKAFACDLGPYGIRVNNIVPGYIKTDMTKVSYENKATFEERRNNTLLGRWGEVQDLTGAAIFLSSEASEYITGQDIVVDGGWLAKGLVNI